MEKSHTSLFGFRVSYGVRGEEEEEKEGGVGLCFSSVMDGWGRVKRKKLEMEKPPPRLSRDGRRWKMKCNMEQI